MSDFEIFSGAESSDSYDPASFERFKERIKKNAAFLASLRKSEQKQKKKEDELAKILARFIQQNQKRAILLIAAALLRENIPPSFILSIILLGNEDLQKEAGILLLSEPVQKSEFSLLASFEKIPFPIHVKAELEAWILGMKQAAEGAPFRILETTLDKDSRPKKIVIDGMANVLDDYLAREKAPEVAYDTCFSFSEFLFHSLLTNLKQKIEQEKELSGERD